MIEIEFHFIPPSSNNQYRLVRRGNKTFHVPSAELTLFKERVAEYPFSMSKHFAACHTLMKQWTVEKKLLSIECNFFFRESRIFTKKHEPKKIDCSNYIKALHDSVALLFGIDDSRFFHISAEKSIAHAKHEEMTRVLIKPL